MTERKSICVTGANGFVGTHLVKRLLADGRNVRAFVKDAGSAASLQETGAQVVQGNIKDVDSLAKAFKDVEAVVHLVAITRERKDDNFRTVNKLGARNVVEAMGRAGTKRLVFTSISTAGPNASSAYLRSKWAAEEEIRKSTADWTILRLGLIYGPGGKAIGTMAAMARRLPVIPVFGDGKYQQQPIYVGNVVDCLSKTLGMDETTKQVYDVAGPTALSYNRMMDLIAARVSKKRPKIHLPLALMRPFISLGQKVLPNPLVTIPELDLLIDNPIPDRNRITDVFGIDPLPMEEGLTQTFADH
ncbi:MAG: SDR family oxidoreductase [Terriglobia bacterium]